MKAILVSMLRINGWRRSIQTRRASATSGRFCSTARRSFFVCQAQTAQMPPNRNTVGFDALDLTKFDHQFIKGQVALFHDPASDPIRHASQFAMTTTVALLLGLKRPGGALQEHHVIHELDRNPELRRRSPVRVTFLNKINDPLTKLHRKWPAHQ